MLGSKLHLAACKHVLASHLMAYATRRRRRRSARSKRLWQSMIRRLRGPQLSADDLRTFEDTEVDGRDRTDSAARLQAQWDASERPDLDAPSQAASQPGELTLDAQHKGDARVFVATLAQRRQARREHERLEQQQPPQ